MFLLRILSLIPMWLLEPVETLLYWLTYFISGRDRQLIHENLFRVYRIPSRSSFAQTFVRQVFRSHILMTFEMLKYVFQRPGVEAVGLDDLRIKVQEMEEGGQGIVFITSHLGSWDLSGFFSIRAASRPFYALGKPTKSKYLTKVLDEMRGLFRANVLWTDSRSLFRDMLSVIDRGEHLGFVMDQRPNKKGKGHLMSFLGVPNVPIVEGPATIACRKNTPVISVHAVREGLGRHRIVFEEVLPRNHGQTDEFKVTELMTRALEKVILTYPEQWAWNYNRFKYMPLELQKT